MQPIGKKFNLSCHPSESNSAVHDLHVMTGIVKNGFLSITFSLKGDFENLNIPLQNISARSDDLWKHTCFEAFIGSQISTSYTEFNISPSKAWAAYQFENYRADRHDLSVSDLSISIRKTDSKLEMDVLLPLPHQIENLCMGFSAVIQDKSGQNTYWALYHPVRDRPDFHHKAGFVLKALDLKL